MLIFAIYIMQFFAILFLQNLFNSILDCGPVLRHNLIRLFPALGQLKIFSRMATLGFHPIIIDQWFVFESWQQWIHRSFHYYKITVFKNFDNLGTISFSLFKNSQYEKIKNPLSHLRLNFWFHNFIITL